MPSDLRSRKRLAMRQAISDAATQLFFEQGFDNVTIDDVAKAADVGRMTVFNYFPRKEDMYFDLDEEGREILRTALRDINPDVGPIETLRLLAHQLVAEQSSLIDFSDMSQRYIETIKESETLKARVRAIRDELAQLVKNALCEFAGCSETNADAHLAANLLLATWSAAFTQAHDTYKRTKKVKQANAVFLAMIDKGTKALKVSVSDTISI